MFRTLVRLSLLVEAESHPKFDQRYLKRGELRPGIFIRAPRTPSNMAKPDLEWGVRAGWWKILRILSTTDSAGQYIFQSSRGFQSIMGSSHCRNAAMQEMLTTLKKVSLGRQPDILLTCKSRLLKTDPEGTIPSLCWHGTPLLSHLPLMYGSCCSLQLLHTPFSQVFT